MTQKSIWEHRWKQKSKDILKSTSLDFFALKAFQVLDRHISTSDQKILEIGSGTGRFCLALSEKYPNKKIIGIDYTNESIDLSKKGAELKNLKNVEFLQADLFKLPFSDNNFDVVFENGVIEHFYNYPEAIQEMKRVTKKGGQIIINVNNWYCFPKTLEKKVLGKYYPFGYEKSFKHREIKEVFDECGLKEMEIYAYNPSNYIVRFFFFNKYVKKTMAIITSFFERSLDFISKKKFSRRFGYMIFGRGIK